jgi:MFS transporter, YNFM family, putative membrane transport protein
MRVIAVSSLSVSADLSSKPVPQAARTAAAQSRLRVVARPATTPVWTTVGSAAFARIGVALFIAGFSSFSLIYAVQPLLPNLAVEFAVSPTESSLALSLTTGFLAFAIFCAGAVSEVAGRRGLMFVSTAGAAVLHIVGAMVTDWHLLLALRAVEGFVLGGVPAVAMAYLAEEIHPKSLGVVMGLYVGGTAFGAMMGRVGMGVLTEFSSWRVALGVLGIIDLVSAFVFFVLLPRQRNFARCRSIDVAFHGRAWLEHLRTPGLPALFLTAFLALGIFVITFNYLTFRLTAQPYGLNQAQIAFIFIVYLFGVVSSSVAGSLADRMGRGTLLITGFLVIAAGTGLMLLEPLACVIGGVVVVTIGFYVVHSVASGWVGRLAKVHKGHASSLYLLAYYLGSSTMGSAGGWFWTRAGWDGVAAFNAFLLVVGLAVGARLLILERRPTSAREKLD